ncbi:alpha/beta hydrolase [Chloroflexi bacterium TSY]|nr:alpha/beta hydrolase [Chloroflexi bacterium TSY]
MKPIEIIESEVVYKSVGSTQLQMHLFMMQEPAETTNPRACILFFHGGRFIQGHPAQFYPHCRYFVSRNMVAISAEYRLLGKNATSITACLADCKSAIRWLRVHADQLALDPDKIVAAGGSAGANLAANAAMNSSFDESNEDLDIRSQPDALVLFSPAIVRPQDDVDLIDERLFADLTAKPQLPPMLLLHGIDDEFFPAEAMQDFRDQIAAYGNQCDLKLFSGEKHGFFNYLYFLGGGSELGLHF